MIDFVIRGLHYKDTSMSVFFAFAAVVVLYALIRLLHLNHVSEAPKLYFKEGSKFVQNILSLCPILTEVYVPTLLWGKSGHLQTFIYAKLGRVKSPFPKGNRHYIDMPDGALMTFDVFEPYTSHKSKEDLTFMICPGLANSSEASYICTFSHNAQEQGYRVAVLNHLGSLKSVKLNTPRMFTYGCTDEFGRMVEEVKKCYPDTKLLAVGFSMGANIITKYLGESKENEKNFLCGMSICQGYDANKCVKLMLDWQHMRRAYVYAMTAHQKVLLRNHRDVLLNSEVKEKYGLNEDKILAATSLLELDEQYSRRRAGFNSVEDYYHWSSCVHVIDNVNIPMFFLNAEDDPIVPPVLLDVAKQYAKTHENSLLVVTKHGGHLGYFEGGTIVPDTLTWLDRTLIKFADAVVSLPVQNGL